MFAGILLCLLPSFPFLVLARSAVETFIVYRGDQIRENDDFPNGIPAEALRDAIQADLLEVNGASSLAKSATTSQPHGTSPAPAGAPAPADEWNGGHESSWFGCEDKPPEETGFEVHTDDGFLGYASCQDLANKCHNWINSTKVQKACPISCFICDPNAKPEAEGPPCYDAATTGIRFKLGPQATCQDLANYCNHTTLWYHVQAACRLTCGMCDAHVGHVEGKCHDLEAHDQPELMVSGQIAACTDLVDFCDNSQDSYLIRHKCPRTCGACPDQLTSTAQSSYTSTTGESFNMGEEKSDCDRRRRWGFCSTRRRRNL